MDKNLPLDFPTLKFCGEARQGYGEDNWCCGFCENSGLIAVFDGCGGSGARQHRAYADHSEAYMASRLCAGVVYECIQSGFPYTQTAQEFAQQILSPAIRNRLEMNVPSESVSGIRISGLRTLPSTIAAALIGLCDDGQLEVSSVWAGDSRVYVLDTTGLSQLTADDSNQPDPMEGLYDDGTLTNVLCADRPYQLNCRTFRIKPPFMVIAATDGCFGYVSTPMEFEGMILHTMLESSNVAQWEDNLQKLIASFAGDDHTLLLSSFGFGSFGKMQKAFAKRYEKMKRKYLEKVWEAPWEDRELRRRLWKAYRKTYMKYIESERT